MALQAPCERADFADVIGADEAPALWHSPQVIGACLTLGGVLFGCLLTSLAAYFQRKGENDRFERRERAERERMIRDVLVGDYVDLLRRIADLKYVWTERALLDDPPPESAEREAVSNLGRSNFRVCILDGDEETRVLATRLGNVLARAMTEFPIERLRSLDADVRERHVHAVRDELRDAEKQLIMKLESRFRIAPRTNWKGEFESWEPK